MCISRVSTGCYFAYNILLVIASWGSRFDGFLNSIVKIRDFESFMAVIPLEKPFE